MIVITGGACQGKLGFCGTLMHKEKEDLLQTADGRTDSYEDMLHRPVIDGFHHYIRRMLEDGVDWNLYVDRLLSEHKESVVILDEVGCGIVPMEKCEREYRDAVGMAGQRLAAEAKQVYRVICGIGTRIK